MSWAHFNMCPELFAVLKINFFPGLTGKMPFKEGEEAEAIINGYKVTLKTLEEELGDN